MCDNGLLAHRLNVLRIIRHRFLAGPPFPVLSRLRSPLT